jgi:hypothetical protein
MIELVTWAGETEGWAVVPDHIGNLPFTATYNTKLSRWDYVVVRLADDETSTQLQVAFQANEVSSAPTYEVWLFDTATGDTEKAHLIWMGNKSLPKLPGSIHDLDDLDELVRQADAEGRPFSGNVNWFKHRDQSA